MPYTELAEAMIRTKAKVANLRRQCRWLAFKAATDCYPAFWVPYLMIGN